MTTTTTISQQISAGVFDKDLADMEKAIEERLRAVRTARTSSQFGIGDMVVFNTFCGTKYVQGKQAMVVGMKQKKLIVKMADPIGRFAKFNAALGEYESVEVVVPPSIVDLV